MVMLKITTRRVMRITLSLATACLLVTAATTRGYTITGEVEGLLLTEKDMPEFRLSSQAPSLWVISERQIVRGARQTWSSRTSYDEEIMVDVCLLKDTALANKCAYTTRKETSEVLAWGSHKGQFLGGKLWVGTNAFKNAAFLFVKYNVVVRVIMVKCEPEQMKLMEDAAQKILRKIDARRSRNPSEEYAGLKKQQISEELFGRLVSEAERTVLSGFSDVRKGDALWLFHRDGHYQFGRRREWRREDGILIGISMVRCRNEEQAQRSAEIRRDETYGTLLRGDLSRPRIPRNIEHFESVASVIFTKDHMAVHIYQYNRKRIDIGLFDALVRRLSQNL